MRTLREMDAEPEMRAKLGAVYREAQVRQTGAGAVSDAMNVQALKDGSQVQLAVNGMALEKTQPATTPPSGYKVAQNYAQQVRNVRGRTFYQNGLTWTDAQAQAKQNLKRQEIAFNSDAYFALLQAHPDIAAWLSLGNQIDLVLDDTLYVIR
jgi:hypothetical protein